MKLLIAGAAILATVGVAAGPAFAQWGTGSNPRSNTVDGYIKKDGTPVAPHQRTNPNDTPRDNYKTPGNYNPNPPRSR